MNVQELIDVLNSIEDKQRTVYLGDRNNKCIFPDEIDRPEISKVDHDDYFNCVFLDVADKKC